MLPVGFAAITLNKAALWTDGRYFTQANQQLDSEGWVLMKEGLSGTPTTAEWLNQVLPTDSRVGFDSRLFTPCKFLYRHFFKFQNRFIFKLPLRTCKKP